MAITFIITNAGRNALVNAANTGTAPVTIAQAGLSSSAIAPNSAATALPGEFKRITTLSGDVVADDTIHIIVRDESSDVFTLRSIGLYLADGTLFGIYGQADPLLEKSAQALMLLAIDIRFEDVAASAITFGNANFLNPPATTERQGVVELATVAEAKAGSDAVRAVTPAAAKQAVVDWIGYAPANRGGDTFSGAFGRDSAFYFNLLGGSPLLNFDENDYMLFDRGTNVLSVVISGTVRATLGTYGLTIGTGQAWHSANDGSGSGLDADLLDGQDGGYYTNITARLGYTPINKGGDNVTAPIHFQNSDSQPIASRPTTAAPLHVKGVSSAPAIISFERSGIYAGYFGLDTDNRWKVGGWSMAGASYVLWHAGNDGAGSGLDADLLDGQDGGYYANIAGRLGYTPANKAGDIFTGSIARDPVYYLDLIGSNPLLNFDANDYLLFDRGINRLSVVIGGTVRAGFAADGWLSVQSGVLINGIAAWHAGNDGSGSGLDADFLDGQDSSYFTNIPARLGYAPLNKAGDMMSGPLDIVYPSAALTLNSSGVAVGRLAMQSDGALVLYRDDGAGAVPIFSIPSQTDPFNVQRTITRQGYRVWDAANDGAGSGMDADLLDGQDGSFYTDIPSRLGYAPVNKGGDTMSGPLDIVYPGAALTLNSSGVAVGRLAMQSDGALVLYRDDGAGAVPIFSIPSQTDPFNVQRTITRQGYLVWDAANDGSGSGMDADLLDGQDGSYYTNITARLGYTPVSRGGDRFTGGFGRDGTFYFDLLGGNPLLNLDDNDYLLFDRGINVLSIVLGGVVRASFSTNDLAIAGGLAWHSSNDGSGSGLDADMLDGQHGGFYADIPARLGYTPVNKAGDTMTGPLDITYAGSATLSLNSAGVAVGRLAMQSDGALVLYRDDGAGQRPIFSIPSQTDPFNVQRTMTRQGNLVWDAGNDGSGSGLDADLLDGLDASAFARMGDFGNSLGDHGFQRLPNGLILQWGSVVAPAGGVNNVTFPVAFPNQCLAALATNQSAGVPAAWAGAGNITQTGMTVGHASSSLNASAAGTAAFWQAIGR